MLRLAVVSAFVGLLGCTSLGNSDGIKMPETAKSLTEIAKAFDAAGVGSIHSEKRLRDGDRYLVVIWKNPYSGAAADVIYAYYFDGEWWVRFYQGSLPMGIACPRIEQKEPTLILVGEAISRPTSGEVRSLALSKIPAAAKAPAE